LAVKDSMISLTTADLVGAAIACLPGRGSRFFRRHDDATAARAETAAAKEGCRSAAQGVG
jgi:hypothetical protein